MLVILFLVLLSTSSVFGARGAHSYKKEPMVAVLDAVEQMMTGSGKFDRSLYKKVKSCMRFLGPPTEDTHNSIYQGIFEFWESKGLPTDRWGSFDNGYNELNVTSTLLDGLTVQEPCNTASNIPYYYTLLELCQAAKTGRLPCLKEYTKPILRSIAYLLPTSVMHHTSGMKVGLQLDYQIIDVIIYLVYQASIDVLPYDPIIHDLSSKPRSRSSLEFARDVEDMYLNKRARVWGKISDSFDLPSRQRAIGAFIASTLSAGMNPFILRLLAPSLAQAFNMPEEDYNFITYEYLPTISKALDKLNKNGEKALLKNFISSFAKFGYAFLWYASSGTENSKTTFGAVLNFVGSAIVPAFNSKFNFLNSYEYNFKNLQSGHNLYSSESRCNPKFPHALWHVQSAVSIVDSVKSANTMCVHLNS